MKLSCLKRPTRAAVMWLAACSTLALAAPALAQSVPPNSPDTSAAGGPLAGQTPPGVRPPQSQPLPAEALPGGRPGPQGVPQAIRWTEDWSADPGPDASLLDRLKHIPIGDGDTYLTIGGEVRGYYTDWRHSTLGLRQNDDNDPFQLRLRLLADLHVNDDLRAYVELGDNREFGQAFATPPNQDHLDIYQAFVDVTVPLGEAGKLTVRPGRFEMPLGNGKLVGVREGLNMRFTYQGVRATYILPGKVSIDAFAVQPINIRPGSFDDAPNHTTDFRGVYVSAPNRVLGFGTDVYWYEVDRDHGVLAQGAGRDDRDNWGGRLWKRTRAWDFDLEGDYQTGRFIDRDIQAYAVLFEGGYTFNGAPLKPRLGARANLFSGDDNLSDGVARTFVPAFPRLPLISEAAFFNLSNLMDFYPSVTIKPRKDVTVMAGPDFLWRHSKADGVYIGSGGTFIAPYDTGRFIGTDFNVEASWQATRRLQFRLFETYFSPSQGFAGHGGKNGNYLGLQTDYRF